MYWISSLDAPTESDGTYQPNGTKDWILMHIGRKDGEDGERCLFIQLWEFFFDERVDLAFALKVRDNGLAPGHGARIGQCTPDIGSQGRDLGSSFGHVGAVGILARHRRILAYVEEKVVVVRDGKNGVGAVKGPLKAGLVLLVGLDYFHPFRHQGFGSVALGVPGDATDSIVRVGQEGVDDTSPLTTSCTDNDDEFRHGFVIHVPKENC